MYQRSLVIALAAFSLGTHACTGGGGHSINPGDSSGLEPSVPLLQVQPTVNFEALGPEGGPFVGAPEAYQLKNEGTASGSWTVVPDAPWILVSNTASITLAPGEQQEISISIDPTFANAFSNGEYAGSIQFVGSSGIEARRNVALRVNAPNPSGWTEIVPSEDTRRVYVDGTAGNDANDGLSPETPKQSLAAGIGLLRNLFPDHLLVKRGSSFMNQATLQWTRSGRSASEPMVVDAYGDESLSRPVVEVQADGGFLSSLNLSPLRYLLFRSLDVRQPSTRTAAGGGTGVLWANDGSESVTFEDLAFTNFGGGFNVRAGTGNVPLHGITINRCGIFDGYRTGSGAQGILCTKIDGLTLTDVIVDRCGWVDAAFTIGHTQQRNIYIQDDCPNLVVTGVHSHRSASNGAQFRPGGRVSRYFSNDSCSTHWGWDASAQGALPFASGYFVESAILNFGDVPTNPPAPDGTGLVVANVGASGGLIAQVLIAHGGGSVAGGGGLVLRTQQSQTCQNLTVRDLTVYDTDWPLRIWPQTGNFLNVFVHNNHFEALSTGSYGAAVAVIAAAPVQGIALDSNNYRSALATGAQFVDSTGSHGFAEWISLTGERNPTNIPSNYSSPNRGIADYVDFVESSSGSTNADFYARLRTQRKGHWNAAYETTGVINFIRGGFDLAPLP